MCIRDRDSNVESLHRLLSQNTRSRLTVLVLQGILQILHRQSEVCKFVGQRPYLHGIVAATDVGNTSHTGDTAQQVEYIDRRNNLRLLSIL